MKLKNLNGLIRKNDGSVKMKLVTDQGVVVIGLIKSELIGGLAAVYPDNMTETNLTIVDGFLAHEVNGDRFAARSIKDSSPEIVPVDEDQLDLLDEDVGLVDENLFDPVESGDLDDLLA